VERLPQRQSIRTTTRDPIRFTKVQHPVLTRTGGIRVVHILLFLFDSFFFFFFKKIEQLLPMLLFVQFQVEVDRLPISHHPLEELGAASRRLINTTIGRIPNCPIWPLSDHLWD
jgi:hypothetical protein